MKEGASIRGETKFSTTEKSQKSNVRSRREEDFRVTSSTIEERNEPWEKGWMGV